MDEFSTISTHIVCLIGFSFHLPFSSGDSIFSKAKNKKNFDYQFIDFLNQLNSRKIRGCSLPLANRGGLPKVKWTQIQVGLPKIA